MARQRIHNRRAGRGSSVGGASWISYSDMMAALLLIFVLILVYSLYQYFTMMETKTRELEAQSASLLLMQTELEEKETTLNTLRVTLDEKETELQNANLALVQHQTKLGLLESQMALQKAELDAATRKLEEQQLALDAQAQRIEDLVGIRTAMIRDLSDSLAASGLNAKVDPNTGDIVLDSAVFFETGKATIRDEGRAFLDRFVPVYLDVLLRDEYADYLGEIIIEGHTDSTGTYNSNLKLSQDRALQVALYCLDMPSLTRAQKARLQQILTATGRSSSDLILGPDGREDPDASRRVEFKFSLRDADMIREINRILQPEAGSEGGTP